MCLVGLLVCFDGLYILLMYALQCVVCQVAISMTAALAWEQPCTTPVRVVYACVCYVNLSLTVLLNTSVTVAVKGALLSMGDAHLAQGDGELDGTAIETHITGEVTTCVCRASLFARVFACVFVCISKSHKNTYKVIRNTRIQTRIQLQVHIYLWARSRSRGLSSTNSYLQNKWNHH